MMADNKLTITGYSTALFSTWYYVDELSLLFDCGDGVTSGLLQKARKINMSSLVMRIEITLADLCSSANSTPDSNIAACERE